MLLSGTEKYSINNTTPSDEGWYCCVVTNECGAVEECAWLEIDSELLERYSSMYFYIECNLATPVIVKNPRSIVIKEYSNEVFLECSAHDYGIGSIQYRWEKYQPSSDTWMIPNRADKIFMFAKLVFDEIREEDQGMYRCVAINNDGSVISEHATITVYGKITEELYDVRVY